MMIERQEFATEHIHVVKPLRISLNITWYLAACTIWCTGKNVKKKHETAMGIC